MDYFLDYFEVKLIIFKKNSKKFAKPLALYNICGIIYNSDKDEPSHKTKNRRRKMKKVTLKSNWGLISPVTFRILSTTPNGNYIVSYSSAKKAARHNSGDYYPGLEILESHFCGGEPYAIVHVDDAKITAGN